MYRLVPTDRIGCCRSLTALRTATLLPLVLTFGLAGCATWHALPLDEGRGVQHLGDITVSADTMALPPSSTHRFDPTDGLDVTEVAMLAVANSPELRLKRDELGIAHAQAFAAGLLPDPQIGIGIDHPTTSGQGLVNAFNLGLSYDIGSLLARSSRVAASRLSEQQVHLELLWSEWQTIARARELFDNIVADRQLAKRLGVEQTALDAMLPQIRRALKAGDLTYDGASVGLNAGADVANRLADSTRKLNQDEHDLHALLGLAAQVPLDLVGPMYASAYSQDDITQALAAMLKRRPDLLSLQVGYAAQDAKLREAIQSQYPGLSIGFNHAGDTSAVHSNGLSVALNLPIFNRNRGNIAIESATRQKLHDDYDARVQAARLDIDRLAQDQMQYNAQRERVAQHAAELDLARDAAVKAYAANLLDWPTYLSIRAAALAADTDLLTFDSNRAQAAVALDAVIGPIRFDTPSAAKSFRP